MVKSYTQFFEKYGQRENIGAKTDFGGDHSTLQAKNEMFGRMFECLIEGATRKIRQCPPHLDNKQ